MPQYNPITQTWQRRIVRRTKKDINIKPVDYYVIDIGIKSYTTYRTICQELLKFDPTIQIAEVIHANQMIPDPEERKFEFIFTFAWTPGSRTIRDLEKVLHSNKGIKHIAVSPEYSESYNVEDYVALTEDV